MEFETVYTEMFSPLYKYVFWRVRNPDETMDIIQTTFLKVFEKYRNRSFGELQRLLYVTARNEVFDRSKKRKFVSLDPSESLYSSIPDTTLHHPEDTLASHEGQQMLGVLLEQLEDIEREAILLRYLQEKDYSEIAHYLGKTESNTRQIISRGLKKLHTIYENYESK